MKKKDATNEATLAKRLNIYRVVTHFDGKAETDHEDHSRTDYVRAKTLQGARSIIADKYIAASLATTDELLALANVKAVE